MAELADALDLGSSDFIVGVQVPSSAPKCSNPNLLLIGERFGFVVYKIVIVKIKLLLIQSQRFVNHIADFMLIWYNITKNRK